MCLSYVVLYGAFSGCICCYKTINKTACIFIYFLFHTSLPHSFSQKKKKENHTHSKKESQPGFSHAFGVAGQSQPAQRLALVSGWERVGGVPIHPQLRPRGVPAREWEGVRPTEGWDRGSVLAGGPRLAGVRSAAVSEGHLVKRTQACSVRFQGWESQRGTQSL